MALHTPHSKALLPKQTGVCYHQIRYHNLILVLRVKTPSIICLLGQANLESFQEHSATGEDFKILLITNYALRSPDPEH